MACKLVASLPKRVSRPALRPHLCRQVRVGRVCIPRHKQRDERLDVKHLDFDGIKQSELRHFVAARNSQAS